jgi:hypothetical protein
MRAQVSISKDDTIILDGAGQKGAINERCDQLREAVASSTSDYDRCAPLWALRLCVLLCHVTRARPSVYDRCARGRCYISGLNVSLKCAIPPWE